MSATRRAMCVHVGVRRPQLVQRGVVVRDERHSLVVPSGITGLSPPLHPEHQRVAPRVDERGVEPVELGPVVVAPEDLGAADSASPRIRSIESSSLTRIHVRAVRPTGTTSRGSTPAGVGMRPRVRGVEDAHVQVARRSRRAVVEEEGLAGHDPVERRRPGAARPPSRTRRRRTRPTRPDRSRGSRRRSACWGTSRRPT